MVAEHAQTVHIREIMARKAITQELYEKLYQAALIKPGNLRYMSKMACCDPRTAKVGWITGWPHKGMIPIQLALQNKHEAARAARQKAADDKALADQQRLDKAREDAVKTESQEAELTGETRKWLLDHVKGALAPLTVIGVLQAQKMLADQRAGTLVMTPEQASRFIGRVALMQRYAAETARTVLEVERLRLGEPTHILGIRTEEISSEQAAEELAAEMQNFLDGQPLAADVVAARKGAQDVH